jgi:hypothetical protein
VTEVSCLMQTYAPRLQRSVNSYPFSPCFWLQGATAEAGGLAELCSTRAQHVAFEFLGDALMPTQRARPKNTYELLHQPDHNHRRRVLHADPKADAFAARCRSSALE